MDKQNLINLVLDQIINDINDYDLTAIEELLWKVDEKFLIAYLPEERTITYG